MNFSIIELSKESTYTVGAFLQMLIMSLTYEYV